MLPDLHIRSLSAEPLFVYRWMVRRLQPSSRGEFAASTRTIDLAKLHLLLEDVDQVPLWANLALHIER